MVSRLFGKYGYADEVSPAGRWRQAVMEAYFRYNGKGRRLFGIILSVSKTFLADGGWQRRKLAGCGWFKRKSDGAE